VASKENVQLSFPALNQRDMSSPTRHGDSTSWQTIRHQTIPNRRKGSGTGGRVVRAALQVAGGMIPLAGGFISAAAGAWGEHEQDRVNAFVNEAIGLLRDDLREKQETIAEVVARLDLNDKKIDERVKSADYQKLLRKALRNWAGAESGRKREFIRNILSNAAAASLTSDDVVDMFLTWLHTFSELHFTVIGDVYQHPGTTRGEIWRRIGSGPAREDSAEATSTGCCSGTSRRAASFGSTARRTTPAGF